MVWRVFSFTIFGYLILYLIIKSNTNGAQFGQRVWWWWCKRPDWTYTLTQHGTTYISWAFAIVYDTTYSWYRCAITAIFDTQCDPNFYIGEPLIRYGRWARETLCIHALWEMSIRIFFRLYILSWKKKNMFFVYPWLSVALLLLFSHNRIRPDLLLDKMTFAHDFFIFCPHFLNVLLLLWLLLCTSTVIIRPPVLCVWVGPFLWHSGQCFFGGQRSPIIAIIFYVSALVH